VFAPNDKENPEVYEGTRAAPDIVNFALDKKKDYGKDFAAPKLDSQSILLDTCDKKKTLCVLFLLDDQEA
jgi:hypothetical protein